MQSDMIAKADVRALVEAEREATYAYVRIMQTKFSAIDALDAMSAAKLATDTALKETE